MVYWGCTCPPRRPERHKWAIRQGDWKLFTDFDSNRRQADESKEGIKLVNLATDIREEKDFSQEKPEKVKELKILWDKWNSEMAKPGGTERTSQPNP